MHQPHSKAGPIPGAGPPKNGLYFFVHFLFVFFSIFCLIYFLISGFHFLFFFFSLREIKKRGWEGRWADLGGADGRK